MSTLGNSLRATEIYVNSVHLVLDHFGGLDHCLGIVATKLSYKRSIFLTCSKMLILVIFCGGHHFGMKHGRVTQIRAILSAEKPKRELRLIHHGCTDEQWLFGKEG